MRYWMVLSFLLFGTAGLLFVSGCGPASTVQSTEVKHSPSASAEGNNAPEGLAELEPADRAAAQKQGVCPVTGERLGSMGKPVKTTVKGRTVFLCCEGCIAQLNNDPDKYLAKLPKGL